MAETTVKRNFLGGRTPTNIQQANQDVLTWCVTTAGQRTHGTTKVAPLTRFETTEQAARQPLSSAPYDLAIWKLATVHRDCYVVFEQAFYSVPFRLVGQRVQVRGGSQTVQIYTEDFQAVATHPRATTAGARLTHPDHLPPTLLPGVVLNPEACQASADDIGPATGEVVQTLLADPVLDRRRTVLRLLSLRERYGDDRLEAACARALRFASPTYAIVKRILQQGLEQEPVSEPTFAAPAQTFVRTPGELRGHLFGGLPWMR